MFSHCLTIIIGDFNIDFLTKIIQLSTLSALMNKYNLKLIFLENTIINDMQINHIWTNVEIQHHSRSTQTYWTNHKPIYFAFKLLDYVPQFVLP
jgi:hypothetical protein